jgi:uncharacterized protein (TIGR03546 family)
MTLIFKQIYAFLKLLNSDTGTNSLAWGLSLGLILGFSPILSLQGLAFVLIILFFRVQIGAAFLSAFFFKFVAYLLDPVTDLLGRWVLENPDLKEVFTSLYHMPLVPLTRFNNSIVMGSGVLAIALLVPSFFVFRWMVVRYRQTVLERVRNSKWYKALKASPIAQLYEKYRDLYA